MSLILSEINSHELSELTAKKVIEQIKALLEELPKKEEYLTCRETSKLLQLSLPTLGLYCKSGLLPSYRIGKSIRFKKSEIEQIVNKGLRFNIKGKGRAL